VSRVDWALLSWGCPDVLKERMLSNSVDLGNAGESILTKGLILS
jgi:hypothetical protein